MDKILCYVGCHVESLTECEELAAERRLTITKYFESEISDSYKKLEIEGTIGDVCRFFYALGNRKLYVFPSNP